MQPETRYAKSGDVNIAYQVVGGGPFDLVFRARLRLPRRVVLGDVGRCFLNRLASFSRLIVFDQHGTGLSDRVGAPPTLEQRMDDVRAGL